MFYFCICMCCVGFVSLILGIMFIFMATTKETLSFHEFLENMLKKYIFSELPEYFVFCIQDK